jgi:hypothetical protein
MRAAFFIARRYGAKPPTVKAFLAQAQAEAGETLDSARKMLDAKCRDSDHIARTRLEIQERMSTCGAAIRNPEKVRPAVGEAWSLYARMRKELRVRSATDLSAAFKNLDLCLTHALYLEAIHEYLSRGGRSRGSYLVLDPAGTKPCPELGEEWRFALNPRPSFVDHKILEVSLDSRGRVVKEWVDIRPIPNEDSWFENVWEDFREGRIIRAEEE